MDWLPYCPSIRTMDFLKVKQYFTFMYTSISESGIRLASFSLLESSAVMSVQVILVVGSNNYLNKGKKYFFRSVILVHTISCSNSLTPCREGQCFPDCHFADMNIVLPNVSWCLLRDKLIHAMPIVSYSTRDLKANSSVLDFSFLFWKVLAGEVIILFFCFLVHCCHEDCVTFRVDSSLPAKASSRLVLPDPGDPSNKVILQKYTPAIRL